jgi:hypothetical protein
MSFRAKLPLHEGGVNYSRCRLRCFGTPTGCAGTQKSYRARAKVCRCHYGSAARHARKLRRWAPAPPPGQGDRAVTPALNRRGASQDQVLHHRARVSLARDQSPGFPSRKSSQKQRLLLIIPLCSWWRSRRRPSFSEGADQQPQEAVHRQATVGLCRSPNRLKRAGRTAVRSPN